MSDTEFDNSKAHSSGPEGPKSRTEPVSYHPLQGYGADLPFPHDNITANIAASGSISPTGLFPSSMPTGPAQSIVDATLAVMERERHITNLENRVAHFRDKYLQTLDAKLQL